MQLVVFNATVDDAYGNHACVLQVYNFRPTPVGKWKHPPKKWKGNSSNRYTDSLEAGLFGVRTPVGYDFLNTSLLQPPGNPR